MTPNRRALAALSILALASTIQACTTEGHCNDCGPCGFYGGPNETDMIEVGTKGADGGAVVTLTLSKEGRCGLEDADDFWLRWDAGSISLVEAPAGGKIDSSVVLSTGENVYTWQDRELVLSIEGSSTERTFTFVAATTRVVKCSITDGTIVCQPS